MSIFRLFEIIFRRKPNGELTDYMQNITPPNSPLMDAMRNVDADDDRRKITLAQSGEERPVFGLRTTPPPAAPRMPIEDMVTVMVAKRDSGLIADIIRTRMAGGTPQVIDGSEMSAAARAVRYALACDSANGSSAAIDWLRAWSEGDATAEKEMEAFENDG